MKIASSSVAEYESKIPEDKKAAFIKLRETIDKNIPKGFEKNISYNMPTWVVPFSIFPAGYHCTPNQELPFVSLAAQKNFIALYHMGIYSNPELLNWFTGEYPKHAKSKLDMGKSCIRFKKLDDIPYALIGQLMKKMSVKDWVGIYESVLNKRSK